MKKSGLIVIIIALLFTATGWQLYKQDNKNVIQFFPINQEVTFTDIGSEINVFKKNNHPIIVGDSWSKSNRKVYLRQDVNLFYRNGFLINMSFPWKENTNWIVNKMEVPLEKDSIYTLLSYHHAEIHQEEVITSQQAVTADRLYVIAFQDSWEAFKEPENVRQEEQQELLEHVYATQRDDLLNQAIKELNINIDNYEVFDLDTFSDQSNQSKVIKTEEQWNRVLGGLWEGLYRSYVLGFNKNDLKQFSPPMPWILIDRNGTHILVLYRQFDGRFEKLIQEI